VLGQQPEQVLEARCVVAVPELAEQSSVLVAPGDVVVILRPVHSAGHMQRVPFEPPLSVHIEPQQDHPATYEALTGAPHQQSVVSRDPHPREELYGSG
jgi:hypothetical protein